jgi:hypothetical protein
MMSKQLTAEDMHKAIYDGRTLQGIRLDMLENAATENIADTTDKKSRWYRLFGTPERAAQTLHRNGTLECSECLLHDRCLETPEDSKCMVLHQDTLLEWLRGDA